MSNRTQIKIGDIIKVNTIDDRLFRVLAKDEAEDVRSMIGEKFVVDEIRGPYVVVTKEFNRGEDLLETHSVPIHVDDVELVQLKS